MKAPAMCWLLILSLGFLAINICTAEERHVTNWANKLHGRLPFTRGAPQFVSHGVDMREPAYPPSRAWNGVLGGLVRQADHTRWQNNGRQQSRHAPPVEGKPWREASGGEEEGTPRDEGLTSRSADMSARIRAPFGNKNAWVLYKRRSDNNNNDNDNNNQEGNTRHDASRIKRFMDKHGGFAIRAKSNAWILYKREEGDPFVSPQRAG